MNSSLQFLLQAMQALRRKNPLTESFLVQLDLDLESAGIPKPYLPVEKKNSVIPVNTDPVGCSSIFEIRETQRQDAPINQYANNRTDGTNTAAKFSMTNQQSGFDSSSIGNMEIPPQPAPFASMRNLQPDTTQDFSPHRGIPPGSTTFLFDSNANEMDMAGDQPSPSTIHSQSRGGSTSQSSYSPGQQTERLLPYRASPRFTSSQMHTSNLTKSSTAASLDSSYASVDISMNAFPEEAINNGQFSNSYDWEFAAMTGEMNMGQDLGVGLTSGGWNEMLENVMESTPMGWDMMGASHGAHTGASGAGAQS